MSQIRNQIIRKKENRNDAHLSAISVQVYSKYNATRTNHSRWKSTFFLSSILFVSLLNHCTNFNFFYLLPLSVTRSVTRALQIIGITLSNPQLPARIKKRRNTCPTPKPKPGRRVVRLQTIEGMFTFLSYFIPYVFWF